MARIGTAHLLCIALLLSAVVCSDSARVLREPPAAAALLPGGPGEVAEMMVPGQGQRGAAHCLCNQAMARIGAVHLFVIPLLLSAVVCSDSARVLREHPAAAALLPAGGPGVVAEMTVPTGEGQSRGAAADESKRLSPGGPDPQHH
ncbi:hypothetical protein BAE44_0022884 [Dichanthelium oligosanthes]|uniref:Uncharacterized protein n=1 Tax=Dichanthelium oligosanthes TaxID=888268 RepID=A0A1E5UTA1_9POAL|nr:hypothetical protein BAE44_0022884 [Dichanthelium oligosanthes]